MGWFSPVKGSYPSLAQVDKTLRVATSVGAIERGTILTIAADSNFKEGVWNLAAKDSDTFYIALADYSDPTSGFAGDAFNPDPKSDKGEGTPAITAIDLAQDGEYETSVFAEGTYTVGQKLYVGANGKLTNVNDGGKVVGIVTLGNTDRWVNDAIASPKGCTDQRLAYRTGATKTVIRFKTAL